MSEINLTKNSESSGATGGGVDCPSYGIYYPLDELPMDVRKKLYARGKRFSPDYRKLQKEKRIVKIVKLYKKLRKKYPEFGENKKWLGWQKIKKQHPYYKKNTIKTIISRTLNKKIK